MAGTQLHVASPSSIPGSQLSLTAPQTPPAQSHPDSPQPSVTHWEIWTRGAWAVLAASSGSHLPSWAWACLSPLSPRLLPAPRYGPHPYPRFESLASQADWAQALLTQPPHLLGSSLPLDS